MSLHEFLELVSNKLNLGADNDLNSGLARTDDAGNTSGLDLLLVYEQGILDLEAQTGDAVVNRGDVASAAQTFQNDPSRGGKVVVCQLNLALVNSLVIILTTGGLEVECGDHDAEYEVEDYQSSQAKRNNQQGLSSSGQACGEYQVG